MPDATLTAAEFTWESALDQRSLTNIPRSLYAYENVGVEPLTVPARSLYLYENVGVETVVVPARSLYLYENRQIEAFEVLVRSLYAYEQVRDGEVFPWLMRILPTEQYRGGQVDLFGDGFGELLEIAAEATVTASSAGADAGRTVDRTANTNWVSTDGAAAWIRYTFAAARTIVGISLEDLVAVPGDFGSFNPSEEWGIPLFRFSDAGPDVVGTVAAPKVATTLQTAEYPVGTQRVLYAFPARTVTWVEIRVASGGSGTNRGLSEVWILEDLDEAAETSSVLLNADAMGLVVWSNRSPGLHPANGGLPIERAATVTVPALGESGLVVVREAT